MQDSADVLKFLMDKAEQEAIERVKSFNGHFSSIVLASTGETSENGVPVVLFFDHGPGIPNKDIMREAGVGMASTSKTGRIPAVIAVYEAFTIPIDRRTEEDDWTLPDGTVVDIENVHDNVEDIMRFREDLVRSVLICGGTEEGDVSAIRIAFTNDFPPDVRSVDRSESLMELIDDSIISSFFKGVKSADGKEYSMVSPSWPPPGTRVGIYRIRIKKRRH